MSMSVDQETLDKLCSYIERLEEEKPGLSHDIKDVYAEAKAVGFDVPIIRKIVSLRKRQPHELEEEDQLLTLYRMAVGV